jgi:DNA-binding GntR family transcriptional regulator
MPTRRRADLKVRPAPPRRSVRVRPAVAPTPGDASGSSTGRIVEAIVSAIVERRLMPGTKLVEAQLGEIFAVSRTVVRQALNQLSRDRLVTLEPARGAFVAQPSIEEARQVFEARQMIEASVVRELCTRISTAQLAELRAHLRDERAAVARTDVSGRTRLLADFHVVLARLLVADLADVPVRAFGRALAGRARGHRRRAGTARRARRGAADGPAPAQRRAQPAARPPIHRPGDRASPLNR